MRDKTPASVRVVLKFSSRVMSNVVLTVQLPTKSQRCKLITVTCTFLLATATLLPLPFFYQIVYFTSFAMSHAPQL